MESIIGPTALFLIATDGCGRIFALAPDGKVLASLPLGPTDGDGADDDPEPYIEVTRRAFYRLNSMEE